LLKTFNDRATELQVTVARVNDLLSDRNRANLAGALASLASRASSNYQAPNFEANAA